MKVSVHFVEADRLPEGQVWMIARLSGEGRTHFFISEDAPMRTLLDCFTAYRSMRGFPPIEVVPVPRRSLELVRPA